MALRVISNDTTLHDAYSQAVVSAVSKVGPAVVSIHATGKNGSGQGSGVIITPDGFIVTNNHVVENGNHLKLFVANGSHFAADLIGRDPSTDLALLRVVSDNLPLGYYTSHTLKLKASTSVEVVRVDAKSPAIQAGINPGDIIYRINGEEIPSVEKLVLTLGSLKKGDTFSISILRNLTPLTLSVPLLYH